MMKSSAMDEADYYQILNLSFTGSAIPLSKQEIKVAYHKALLKHHPDKAGTIAQIPDTGIKGSSAWNTFSSRPGAPEVSRSTYTIDEITSAYKTLSDPRLRAEYDLSLRLDRSKDSGRDKPGEVFHTGLEVVDLEDLSCDEGDDEAERPVCWYRGCRCGDERGFLVTEDELEKEAEHGEIVVGCRGCSLWLKVLFAVQGDG